MSRNNKQLPGVTRQMEVATLNAQRSTLNVQLLSKSWTALGSEFRLQAVTA